MPDEQPLSSTTVSVPEHLVDWGTTYVPDTVTHHMTLYRHASGALVFGVGTVQWVWGLDTHHDTGPDTGSTTPDLNIQQATMNLLGDMGVQPQTRQPSLFPATPTTDLAPPTSVITSPASGASIPAGTSVTIAGTATDSGGGVVGGVEVSADVDTMPPTVSMTAPPSGATVSGASVTVSATAADNARLPACSSSSMASTSALKSRRAPMRSRGTARSPATALSRA